VADVTGPCVWGCFIFAPAALGMPAGDPIPHRSRRFYSRMRTAALPSSSSSTPTAVIDVTFLEGIVIFIVATRGIADLPPAPTGGCWCVAAVLKSLLMLLGLSRLFPPGVLVNGHIIPMTA